MAHQPEVYMPLRALFLVKLMLINNRNLCFRTEIRKVMYTPLNTNFKTLVGLKGILITWEC